MNSFHQSTDLQNIYNKLTLNNLPYWKHHPDYPNETSFAYNCEDSMFPNIIHLDGFQVDNKNLLPKRPVMLFLSTEIIVNYSEA